MTEPSQPALPPAAFAVMSVLVIRAGATLADLAEHLKEKPEVLQEAVKMLTEGEYAAQTIDPDARTPTYRSTPKGQTAFFEQVSWLKRKMTDQE